MKKTISILTALALALIMSVSAFAANFTPSVSQKGAPEVVKVITEKGETVVAIINDPEGNEICGVPEHHLIVTPISEADNASETVKNELYDAQSKLSNADKIGDVVTGFNDQVKNVAPNTDPDDYVVKDLFSVSLDNQYVNYLDGNNTITVTYETGVDPDDPLIIMYYSNGQWYALDSSCYIRNPDGTVTITTDFLGVFAFAVKSTSVDNKGPKSPYTSDTTMMFVGIGLGCVAVGATVICVKKNKKSN